MSVKLRTFVDVDSPVEFGELGNKEKIFTALRYSLSKVSIINNMRKKKADDLLKKRQEEIEVIKTVINSRIYTELIRGKSLKDSDEIPKAIRIIIPRYLKDTFEYCQKSGEFISYKVRMIEENINVLKANPSMPIIVEISKELILDSEDILLMEEDM